MRLYLIRYGDNAVQITPDIIRRIEDGTLMVDYISIKDEYLCYAEALKYNVLKGLFISGCDLRASGSIEITVWNKYTPLIISHCILPGVSKLDSQRVAIERYNLSINEQVSSSLLIRTRLLSNISRLKFRKKG